MEQSVRLFSIYAREDESFMEELAAQLSLLRRRNIITDYIDKEYSPVDSWDKRSRFNLDDANVLLLLLSPSLLSSGCLRDDLLRQAVAIAHERDVTVIPILIRNCDVSFDSLFSSLAVLPAGGQPVESSLWPDRAQAWKTVMEELKAIIKGEHVEQTAVAAATGAPLLTTHPAPPPSTAVAKGLAWPLKLLFSLLGLGAMGAITYYVVNYDPNKVAEVPAPVDLPDSSSLVNVDSGTVPAASVEPVVEETGKTVTDPKPTKTAASRRAPVKPAKEQPVTKVDTPEPAPPAPPPAPKTPGIRSADLEQMLYGYSQGTVSESEFSQYLCNKLETSVKYNKKTMTFHQMCEEIKDVKAKKVKKITVLSTAFDNNCISSLEVSLKKKGLF